MTVLVIADERFHGHGTPAWHPERPARLDAVAAGIELGADPGAIIRDVPRSADDDELHAVHSTDAIERLDELDRTGGGEIDADTIMGPASWEAARLAAGAGLVAVEALEAGRADAAFCAIRPPGHHATPTRAMGFCLVNNVAVTAAHLAQRGEKVAIIDIDAHHGNGTQAVFEADPRVLFVSFHEWPAYPGTGAATEIGTGAGTGYTVNIPLPRLTTGDVYLRAFDEIVAPELDAFGPSWILISAGYDSHRLDPLTDLGLTSADHAALVERCLANSTPGRTVLFLEGGYDLDALTGSVASTFEVLLDQRRERPRESPTAGGPGQAAVDHLIARHRGEAW